MSDLSVKQVAGRLGVSTRTVQSWIDQHHFPNAYKLNPHASNSPYRIPDTDVAAFEAARRQDHDTN